MFCAAPMSTASIRGVVPILAVMGAKKAGNRVKEKNATPSKEKRKRKIRKEQIKEEMRKEEKR